MRTFVHHDGALGDVLLSLSCLWALREAGRTLHFAGRADIGRLLSASGVIAEASDAGAVRYAGLYDGQPDGSLLAYLSQFDLAVVLTADADGPVSRAVGKAVPGTRTVITVPPPDVRTSASRYRLGQLAPGADRDVRTRLPVPSSHLELALAMLARWGWKGDRPLIMVHPGSGGRRKRWPLDRFFFLARTMVAERGAFVVVSTGPAEDEAFLDQVETYCREQELTAHVGDADLAALAALLGCCSAYVGNDSGVSHLAAAVGAPTIALFGPTDHVVWAPVGTQVKVISAPHLEAISVERVAEEVRASLSVPADDLNGCGPRPSS